MFGFWRWVLCGAIAFEAILCCLSLMLLMLVENVDDFLMQVSMQAKNIISEVLVGYDLRCFYTMCLVEEMIPLCKGSNNFLDFSIV